jgi:hypothetical protein
MFVFCAGMPRSGSTLQYNICREVLRERVSLDLGWVSEKRWAIGYDPRRDVHGGIGLLKCHFLAPWVNSDTSGTEVLTLSTYRDLRDVVASVRDFRPEMSLGEVLDFLTAVVGELDRVESLSSRLVQRYESMISDLPGAVRAAADYLGCAVTDDEVASITERWQVGATRDRARREAPKPQRWTRLRQWRPGHASSPWDTRPNPETLLRADHVSKDEGRPGRYRSVLSEEDVAAVEERFGAWLRERSYL